MKQIKNTGRSRIDLHLAADPSLLEIPGDENGNPTFTDITEDEHQAILRLGDKSMIVRSYFAEGGPLSFVDSEDRAVVAPAPVVEGEVVPPVNGEGDSQ